METKIGYPMSFDQETENSQSLPFSFNQVVSVGAHLAGTRKIPRIFKRYATEYSDHCS